MRPPGSPCDGRAMARITIVLELDQTADTPVGQARLPDGTARTFHGWLGLSEVIDSCIGGDAPGDAASPGSSSGPASPTPG